MIQPTQKSLDAVREIAKQAKTFHEHHHVLADIADQFKGHINYLEIGAYSGASASLMIQRPNTTVVSIDLGEPISPTICRIIVNKFAGENKYVYLKGDSKDDEILDIIKALYNEIDLLFIDGDHSHDAVIRDFLNYVPFVKKGGYIVFDDYQDSVHSPEVKKAVDALSVMLKPTEWEVIGSLPNTLGALPHLEFNNEFIVKKL